MPRFASRLSEKAALTAQFLGRAVRPVRGELRSALAATLALLAVERVRAEAYTPTSDDEVLERLPPSLVIERAAARDAALAGDVDNLKASLVQAARYLRTAEAEGDLRFHGYTRALLRPWWNLAPRPAGVAWVQARIHLDRWEWNEAENALVAMDAADAVGPEATFLKVELALARGNMDWARALLDGLGNAADARFRGRLEAEVLRRQGRATEALRQVQAMRGLAAEHSDLRLGDRLLEADLLRQLGRGPEAESLLREASELVPGHVRWREAMSDLLLDQGRAAEVVSLLERATLTDGLELRVLEAWSRLEPPSDAVERVRRERVRSEWFERVERRRDRGDETALPLSVRASHRVLSDPVRVLERARELWDARPEFASVRVCLEASGVPGGQALRAIVLDWVTRQGATDARWPMARVAEGGTP